MDPSASPQRPLPAEERSLLQRHGAKLAISLLLGVAIAWILSRGGLPLLPPSSTFARLKPWSVAVYVGTLLVVHCLRAIRWRHLLRTVGHVSNRSVLAVSWVGFGAIAFSPLRTGEIIRPYLITKRSSIRLWEATGTIGAERIIDGLVLSLVLLAGLKLSTPLSPLPDHVGDLPVPAAAVPGAAKLALVLFFSAFALMALFFFARDFARRITLALVGLISHSLAVRLADIVDRLAQGLRFLPSAAIFVPFLLETLLYWLINTAGLWLLAWGSGIEGITLAQAAVTVGCLGIGILVPSGPGYFGAFQLSTYMALAMFFPEQVLKGPGAAFVFLLYTTQLGFHLLAALLGLVLDRAPHGQVASSTVYARADLTPVRNSMAANSEG